MKIAIETTYTGTAYATIDLPEGKSWGDVIDYDVKWGTLFMQFAGEKDFREMGDCGDFDTTTIDFKRPDSVTILTVDKDGWPDEVLGGINARS